MLKKLEGFDFNSGYIATNDRNYNIDDERFFRARTLKNNLVT